MPREAAFVRRTPAASAGPNNGDGPMRAKRKFSFDFKLICPVQSPLQKYSAFQKT
jgi:hypothetical protein